MNNILKIYRGAGPLPDTFLAEGELACNEVDGCLYAGNGDSYSLIGSRAGSVYANTVYPVGSIFMSTSTESPSSTLGGTWEEITGVYLVNGPAEMAGLIVEADYDHIHTVTHNHPSVSHNHGTYSHSHTNKTTEDTDAALGLCLAGGDDGSGTLIYVKRQTSVTAWTGNKCVLVPENKTGGKSTLQTGYYTAVQGSTGSTAPTTGDGSFSVNNSSAINSNSTTLNSAFYGDLPYKVVKIWRRVS